jgi:hypothetical protein
MIPSCKTSYPDWRFCGFTQFLHADTGTVHQSRPWPSPTPFVPHHYTWQQPIAEAVTSCSLQRPRFDPKPVHVGYVMNEMAMEQVFFEYFGFPCKYHFTSALYAYFIHLPLTRYNLSNWATDSIIKQHNFVTIYKQLVSHSTLHCFMHSTKSCYIIWE